MFTVPGGPVRLLLAAEPLILLALAPLVWFPRGPSPWVLLAIPLLWLARWRARGFLSVRTPYDGAVVCLLAFLPLACLAVVDWSLALPKVGGILIGIALLYALANSLSTRLQLMFALYCTVIALGGTLAAVGLVGTEWSSKGLLPLQSVYQRLPFLINGLVYGTSRGGVHANEIGGALALVLPIALAAVLTFSRRGSLPRKLLLLLGLLPALLAIAAVLVLTQSRSAYIGAALGVAVVVGWSVVGGRRRPGPAVTAVAIGAAVAPALWLGWRLATSWASAAESGLESFPSRVELWQIGLEMLRDFTFTGVGMGQLSLVLHSLYNPVLVPPDEFVPHAHNFFLQLGLDLGIPGAVAALFMLGAFFLSVWRSYREARDRQLRGAAVGLAAGMLAYLTYGFTDAIVLGARGGIGLWVVLGLAAALARVVRVEAASAPNDSPRVPKRVQRRERGLAGLVRAVVPGLRPRPIDIAWLTPTLAVGAAPAAARLKELRRLGVHSVLDLRTEEERAQDSKWEEAAQRQELRIASVPVPDRKAPTPDQFEKSSAWVLRELSEDRRVLVCCRAGFGRSATLVTAILMQLGYDLPDAFSLVGSHRRVANPTDVQLEALHELASRAREEAPRK